MFFDFLKNDNLPESQVVEFFDRKRETRLQMEAARESLTREEKIAIYNEQMKHTSYNKKF